jgi:flagellar protein FlbD
MCGDRGMLSLSGREIKMIKLTRLDGREIILNCDLIEFFEAMPDTVITLRTEKKIPVRESVDEVLKRIIDYKQSISYTPYYQKGNKIMINADSPDLFLLDKDLKNRRNIIDIKEVDYEDEEGYEEEN